MVRGHFSNDFPGTLFDKSASTQTPVHVLQRFERLLQTSFPVLSIVTQNLPRSRLKRTALHRSVINHLVYLRSCFPTWIHTRRLNHTHDEHSEQKTDNGNHHEPRNEGWI